MVTAEVVKTDRITRGGDGEDIYTERAALRITGETVEQIREKAQRIADDAESPWPDIRVRGVDVGWPTVWLETTRTDTGYVERIHLHKVGGSIPIQVHPAARMTYTSGQRYQLTRRERSRLMQIIEQPPAPKAEPLVREGRTIGWRVPGLGALKWTPMP